MDYQSLMTISAKTLKKVTPFLFSVSVFSFIFSYSSLYSFLLRSFKFYFNALPLQVLNHAVDKGWIFLICNGILVVLANTPSPSGSTFDLNDDLLQKRIGDHLQTPPHDSKDIDHPSMLEGNYLTENAVSREVEGEEKDNINEGENSNLIVKGPSGGESEELRITIIGDEDGENELETCFIFEEEEVQVQEEEEEEEGTFGKLSTEELNKKFEDFIRRMKEELRIEAQQQLIIVK